MQKIAKVLLILAILGVFWSGGLVEASSPIKVCTVQDLNAMRNNLSAEYIQICDINFATSAKRPMEPIGTLGQGFTGKYDGNGYTIHNFTYSSSTGISIGLFAASRGVIKNVRLSNVNVSGKFTVGALAGTNTGTIENSHVLSGVVNGVGNESYHVGGLVGFNGDYNQVTGNLTGKILNSSSAAKVGSLTVRFAGGLVGIGDTGTTISNSYSTGDVYGHSSVGGLVGFLTGMITQSHATGNVFGQDSVAHGCSPVQGVNTCVYVGGLAGGTSWHGKIDRSYSTGNVKGYDNIGGLVGYIFGDTEVSDTYAKGNVSGRSGIGGLIGSSRSAMVNSVVFPPKLMNSYSTGASAGTEFFGGLWGYDNLSNSTETSSYWDTETSGLTTSVYGIGKTTLEMSEQNTFSGWDFQNIWIMGDGASYPILR